MGKTTPASNVSTSRVLAAISMLSETKKARLFDHSQNSHTNSARSQSSPSAVAQPSSATNDLKNQVVSFANAYSVMAQLSIKSNDMTSNSGADQFIFHSLERFVNLKQINQLSIKTVDRSFHMTSHYAGNVMVQSFDEHQTKHQMMLLNTLYCPEISINFISALRLCDGGATFSGTSQRMKYINSSSLLPKTD